MHIQSGRGNGRKKNMNFELNLIPFIDMLSVCICFLLVTAVFINLGSFQVNQAVGSESKSQSKPTGTVSVSLGDHGQVRIEVKDVKGQGTTMLNGAQGRVDFAGTQNWIRSFAARFSDVKTVLILPNANSKYDDLIQLMAQFKASEMDQIGVAPL